MKIFFLSKRISDGESISVVSENKIYWKRNVILGNNQEKTRRRWDYKNKERIDNFHFKNVSKKMWKQNMYHIRPNVKETLASLEVRVSRRICFLSFWSCFTFELVKQQEGSISLCLLFFSYSYHNINSLLRGVRSRLFITVNFLA